MKSQPDSTAAGHEFVFYVYDDNEDDPRFSFWIETDTAGGMSLFERPPEGDGVWLKPEKDSDHDDVEPTEAFREALGRLAGDGLDYSEIDLPAHEEYFLRVIDGTANEDPDAIPSPVWGYINECAGDA